jgi:hypothetical protein
MTKRLQEQLEAESKLNSLRHEKLQRRIQSWAIIPSTKPRPHQLRARVEDWSTQVGNYIKLKAHLIVCEKDGKTEYRWAVRGPFTNSKMFHYSLTSSWPSWTDLSLYLRLRVQNIIPQNSKILTACQMDDVAMVTDLIQTGKAHPNDTTTESLTLIYVTISCPYR